MARQIETSVEGTIVRLRFDNEKTIEVDAAGLTEEIRQQAMLHGLKQKLVDAAAIGMDPDTGRTATTQTKYEAVEAVRARLTDPENPSWNGGRGGAGRETGGLLLAALSRLYPNRERDDLQAWLRAKTPAEQNAMRRSGKVAETIEQIRLERLQASKSDRRKLDGDALLAELGEIPAEEPKLPEEPLEQTNRKSRGKK